MTDLNHTEEQNRIDDAKVAELSEAIVSFISDYSERENCGGNIVTAATMSASSSIIESLVEFMIASGEPNIAIDFIESIRRGWSIVSDRLAEKVREASNTEGN